MTGKANWMLLKELLDHLGVVPGNRIVVDALLSGRAEVRAAKQLGTIDEFIGYLKRDGGPKLSIEQMNEIAAKGWAALRQFVWSLSRG